MQQHPSPTSRFSTISPLERCAKHGFSNFVELHSSWQKALDISALNKRFYQELANWYFWAPQARLPQHAPKDADGRDSLSLIGSSPASSSAGFSRKRACCPTRYSTHVRCSRC